MNKLFKHYIITRFNILYEVSNDYINSEEYLSARFQLFDTYCFPSVTGQTNTNFTWFILLDDKFPEKWRKKMQEYKNQNSNIEIRYMPYIKENEWQNTLNKFLLNELHNLDNSPQYIITTRIDNDDAFNLSYIDEIQNYFLSHQQEAVINFANGLQYVSKCNVLKNHRNKYGHFGTLIEKNDGKAKTVFFFPHNEPPVGLKSICLNNKHPMWIEVLHQTNIMNRTDFQIRSLFKDLFFIGFKYRNLSDFGIKQEILRFNLYTWKVFFEWFCKKIRALLKKF